MKIFEFTSYKGDNYVIPFCIGLGLLLISVYIFYMAFIQDIALVAALGFGAGLFTTFIGILICFISISIKQAKSNQK